MLTGGMSAVHYKKLSALFNNHNSQSHTHHCWALMIIICRFTIPHAIHKPDDNSVISESRLKGNYGKCSSEKSEKSRIERRN